VLAVELAAALGPALGSALGLAFDMETGNDVCCAWPIAYNY
jgi:hypothetical protein